ncbi:MAG TPA: hypothetical protein VGA91_04650 [Candidatus Limnocylindria bacterium]
MADDRMHRNRAVVDVLDALERYAAAFDEVSDESEAHYPAAAFVRWLRLEVADPRREVDRAA